MTLVNATEHAITFYAGKKKSVLPPSGMIARCEMVQIQTGTVKILEEDGLLEIPVYRSILTGQISGLPEPLCKNGKHCQFCGKKGCGDKKSKIRNCPDAPLYVVSRVVVDACPDRTDLVAPHDLMRTQGKVIGCRSLSQA
jgi:hypothetical protein